MVKEYRNILLIFNLFSFFETFKEMYFTLFSKAHKILIPKSNVKFIKINIQRNILWKKNSYRNLENYLCTSGILKILEWIRNFICPSKTNLYNISAYKICGIIAQYLFGLKKRHKQCC